MRWLVAIVMLAAAVSCTSDGDDGEEFQAYLTGLNEVPQLVTLSSGTASFTSLGDQIEYTISVQNITGVTNAQIQLGEAGVVGPVLLELYHGATTGPIGTGILATGSITASSLTAVSLDSLRSLMRSAHAYVNIRTNGAPSGEIRGQITPN